MAYLVFSGSRIPLTGILMKAVDVLVVCDTVILADPPTHWTPDPADRLIPLGDGTWAGFVAGLADGAPYLFWIRGRGGAGFKRAPYARELGTLPPFPNCPCLVRGSVGYPWHDAGWRPPAFHDLVVYQLHIGVFWAVASQGRDRRTGYGRFLDVVERIPYLRDLGINAIQPLPIQEYDGDIGLGYMPYRPRISRQGRTSSNASSTCATSTASP